jgi:hypothetical protein
LENVKKLLNVETFWFEFIFSIFSLDLETFSYVTNSSRMGYINAKNNLTFKLDNYFVPERLFVNHQHYFVKPQILSLGEYTVAFESPMHGRKNVSVFYEQKNSFYFKGTTGVFQNKIKMNITNIKNVSLGDYARLTINTEEIIKQNNMQVTCDDLRVFYSEKEIKRNISGCNSKNTFIYFEIQNETSLSSANYSVYFGNVYSSSPFLLSNQGKEVNVSIETQLVQGELIKLSKNYLEFVFIKKEKFNSQPLGAMLNSSTLEVFIPFDYGTLVSFKLKNENKSIDGVKANNMFQFQISSTEMKLLEIDVNIFYSESNETLKISETPILFQFMGISF